jgi:hypothetical protein
VQGPRRRYGWRCNPIGYQPNHTHIPNEKAWNLREAVFLKSVCACSGHLVVRSSREDFAATAFGWPCGRTLSLKRLKTRSKSRLFVEVTPWQEGILSSSRVTMHSCTDCETGRLILRSYSTCRPSSTSPNVCITKLSHSRWALSTFLQHRPTQPSRPSLPHKSEPKSLRRFHTASAFCANISTGTLIRWYTGTRGNGLGRALDKEVR